MHPFSSDLDELQTLSSVCVQTCGNTSTLTIFGKDVETVYIM